MIEECLSILFVTRCTQIAVSFHNLFHCKRSCIKKSSIQFYFVVGIFLFFLYTSELPNCT
jgi:hypothetical protein